jgi:hypothetical protein
MSFHPVCHENLVPNLIPSNETASRGRGAAKPKTKHDQFKIRRSWLLPRWPHSGMEIASQNLHMADLLLGATHLEDNPML